MTMRSLSVLLFLVAFLPGLPSAAGAGSPLSNDPSPLVVCQDTIRTAGLRLGVEARRVLSACFTAGIECVAENPARAAACCARAADRCRMRLGTLEKAMVRFATFVQNRRCAVVPFADVVAEDGLGYAALVEVCGALEPRGAVDGLAALSECLARLVVRETACTLATHELPRSAEALACMGIDAIDLAGCADGSGETTPTPAPSGTPAPTRTVTTTGTPAGATASRTPTATRTATPVASATATLTPTSVVATQTATPTATPLPTLTHTSTPVAPTTTPSRTSTPVATTTAVPATATPGLTATPPPTATLVPTTATPTPVASPTATRTPTPVATGTPTGPVCGNGVIESGEVCDDGNTTNCDACPKNCLANTAPVACDATTTVRHAQRVRLQAPAGAFLSGGQICLDYPSGVVALPGTGNVTGRTSNLSGLLTLNDFDNAVQLTFVASANNAQVNPTISFDLCTGQTAPLPSAFQCVVKSASNQGTAIDPSLVECTPVTIP